LLAFSEADFCFSGVPTMDLSKRRVPIHGQIVQATYSDSLLTARTLNEAVVEFVDEPTAANLKTARDAWRASREPYLQSEVFRFYGGPIDGDDGPEGLMNAWPLDEAYIDYVEGSDDAGIIGDESVEISADALISLNEAGGDSNIATGYHAIEFLLWGQDLDESGPGDRPHTDYQMGAEGTASHSERRGEYLKVVSQLLVEQLETLESAWSLDGESYRSSFEEESGDLALSKILTGMIILSGFETGGERLQAALDSGDQEDEHSCFSDNTHRDMIQDIQGVLNVYLGRYKRLDDSVIDGTGIREVVRELDDGLASELEAKIRASLELAKALQTPFDQGIALENEEGRQRVAALVTSLREQEQLLEDVFRALELEIPVSE
jgi:putative iron-regulated protein